MSIVLYSTCGGSSRADIVGVQSVSSIPSGGCYPTIGDHPTMFVATWAFNHMVSIERKIHVCIDHLSTFMTFYLSSFYEAIPTNLVFGVYGLS